MLTLNDYATIADANALDLDADATYGEDNAITRAMMANIKEIHARGGVLASPPVCQQGFIKDVIANGLDLDTLDHVEVRARLEASGVMRAFPAYFHGLCAAVDRFTGATSVTEIDPLHLISQMDAETVAAFPPAYTSGFVQLLLSCAAGGASAVLSAYASMGLQRRGALNASSPPASAGMGVDVDMHLFKAHSAHAAAVAGEISPPEILRNTGWFKALAPHERAYLVLGEVYVDVVTDAVLTAFSEVLSAFSGVVAEGAPREAFAAVARAFNNTHIAHNPYTMMAQAFTPGELFGEEGDPPEDAPDADTSPFEEEVLPQLRELLGDDYEVHAVKLDVNEESGVPVLEQIHAVMHALHSDDEQRD